MEAIWQDLRFGVRVLATERQFTAVAVIVLAFGIGATAAVFSIVNAVLLRPCRIRTLDGWWPLAACSNRARPRGRAPSYR
jgi:hypothetical protein